MVWCGEVRSGEGRSASSTAWEGQHLRVGMRVGRLPHRIDLMVEVEGALEEPSINQGAPFPDLRPRHCCAHLQGGCRGPGRDEIGMGQDGDRVRWGV